MATVIKIHKAQKVQSRSNLFSTRMMTRMQSLKESSLLNPQILEESMQQLL